MSERDEQPVLAEIATDGPRGGPAAAGLNLQPATPVVDAELVNDGFLPPPAVHPLRFGMKALLAAMAVCCGQFAFMFYVGALPGLLLTATLCGAGLAALLFGPLFLRRTSRAAWVGRLDGVAIRLALAIAMLLVGAMLAGGGLALHDQFQWLRLARKVHQHLGFSARREDLETEDNGLQIGRDAIHIRSVTPGGAFHQAGFQQGDVILSDLSPHEYYQMLDENRGGTISVQVAGGAVGSVLTPVEDCPQRTLDLQIPP